MNVLRAFHAISDLQGRAFREVNSKRRQCQEEVKTLLRLCRFNGREIRQQLDLTDLPWKGRGNTGKAFFMQGCCRNSATSPQQRTGDVSAPLPLFKTIRQQPDNIATTDPPSNFPLGLLFEKSKLCNLHLSHSFLRSIAQNYMCPF